MEEFREFVNKHPLIRDEVKSGKKTWQMFYEDFYILGPDHEDFKKYAPTKKAGGFKLEDMISSDGMKNILGYVKKINPDSISKTLNTVQKVLQITQSIGGKANASLYNSNYNSWWD